MSLFQRPPLMSARGLLLVVAFVLLAAITIIGRSSANSERRVERQHLEYVREEVEAANVVAKLNELDRDGWDVFQVVPTWNVKNDDGSTSLVPQKYQIFGKKPIVLK
ncbi:MAG: hypothetical protein NVSMB14_13210 [Isosphaeraceae bacterium]